MPLKLKISKMHFKALLVDVIVLGIARLIHPLRVGYIG